MASVVDGVVKLERHGAVAVLTIAHPPANAISRAVVEGLADGLSRAEADEGCRALIITGDGPKFFAAGADIKEFLSGDVGEVVDTQHLTVRFEASRLPVIAAINGFAFGGGCELAIACDIRLAASNARLGQPEINLGIIPGWGGTQRLPRLLGKAAAMPLLLTGEAIDAEEALRIGLVSRVVSPEELMPTAMALAELLASKAPLALAATKRAVYAGLDRPMAEGLKAEAQEFRGIFESADAREGIGAFLEKRQANWQGR